MRINLCEKITALITHRSVAKGPWPLCCRADKFALLAETLNIGRHHLHRKVSPHIAGKFNRYIKKSLFPDRSAKP